MGYREYLCELCGVSFAIARLRTLHEPRRAAWSYAGLGFVEELVSDEVAEKEYICGISSGCRLKWHGNSDTYEHIAGTGCSSTQGYSGHRISLEEMEGCRAIQCLVTNKTPDYPYEPEEDDEDFERETTYFLTGIGDGSPDEAPLVHIQPPRHGVDQLWILPETALQFHPTCFEIFKRVSMARFGRVDVHGLWKWRTDIDGACDNFQEFCHEPAVHAANRQWWRHEVGSEHLVANPIHIPGLSDFIDECRLYAEISPPFVYYGYRTRPREIQVLTPEGTSPSSPTFDPFLTLPPELNQQILGNCSSRSVANLRLVSRALGQIDMSLFRRLAFEDMPWLWEVQDKPLAGMDWYRLYCEAKEVWSDLKGIRNRKRILVDVHEIVTRIERYRREGMITDED